MIEMTPERWRTTSAYLDEVFGREDAALASLREAARAADFPDIAVDAHTGRFLQVLARIAGAKTAIEVGTLGGYSTAWIARGLAPGGRLITIENDPARAEHARRELARIGLGWVEVVTGGALTVLAELARELAPVSVDYVFLDADKREYARYVELVQPLLRSGGLVVADNILGTTGWWIGDAGRPDRDAVDAFSRKLAADPAFDTAGVSIREGVLVARKNS